MKSKYFIYAILSLFIIIVVASFIPLNNQRFYYAYNEKIYLNELDNKLIVRYKQNKKSDKSKLSLYSELLDKQFEWKDDSTYIITIDASEKRYFRDKILKQEDVKSCNPVYSINTGFEMGVTDEFVVRFHENVLPKEIDKLHKKYEVVVVKTEDIYQLLKVPAGSDALEIANKYQESGLTRFSHPNFISDVELHQAMPNDSYFVNQFSLHNTAQVFTDGHFGTVDADIDAPEAWSITRGNNNVIIAVIDEGITPNHPDLPTARQIRLNGSNFGANGQLNDPSPIGNENHGNACAGIIAATQNNNEGITGIAPNCRIMPIRVTFWPNSSTPQQFAAAINFARLNGAHIISNSWGFGQGSTNPNLYPVIRDAIIAATTQGRNGLGCIVVFSASNSADHVQGINGEVRFPANVNVAGVLTVGASDRDDLQANYSPTSNPNSTNNQIIDLVAPSHRAYPNQIIGETLEAWSIDIPENSGYNPYPADLNFPHPPDAGEILPNIGTNNLAYTARFGGTSYSCPQVAGVAALMLSINSNLTQQQVFNILTNSADKVGGYVYTNGRSNEFGFGRLNAYRVVNGAVQTITSINGTTLICNSSVYSITNLPLGATVTWSIPTSAGSVLQLAQNTPVQNQLTITNQKWYSITTTLTATINSGFGDPFTITKTITNDNSSSNIQYGSYYQEECTFYGVYHPSQSGTLNGNAIFLHQGCMTRVTLLDMIGRTVAFSGLTQPLHWSYSNGVLLLQLPYGSGGIPFTFKITGDGACYEKSILFFSISNNLRYTFVVAPNPVNDILTIYAKPSDEIIVQKGFETSEVELEYSVNIFEINTNAILYSQRNIKGNMKQQINVSKLRKGFYLLQIIEGDEIQTIKFLKE